MQGLIERLYQMKIAPRIESDPEICSGKPCIQDTRFPISIIFEWLEAGKSFSDILEAYPFLSKEDIQASLAYARKIVDGMELIPIEMAT